MPADGENVGKVAQVIGSTLDAEFDEDRMPKIYNALKVDISTELAGQRTL